MASIPRKRKAPKTRSGPVNKKQNVIGDSEIVFEVEEANYSMPLVPEDDKFEYECRSTGKMVSDQESQTEYSKYMLSAKVETMVLRNEIATNMNESQAVKVVSNLSYESMCNDSKLMKHFVGLTAPQFDALHSFLDSICPLDNIVYWSGKQSTGLSKKKTGPDSHFSTRETFYLPRETTERIHDKNASCALKYA
ncbi:hypothetical protein QZH41_000115 [Actinostola sp. cb2023]|nr:hypothetical protein QZH41_000115 [Actinostola sp. cb2023]